MGTSRSLLDEWKKLKTKVKGISKRGLSPEALENSLGKIKTNLNACIKSAEKEGAQTADSALKDFRDEVQLDLDNARALVEQVARLKKLEDEFQSLSKKFRELEAKTSEACGKYFDRQQEYVRALRKAEECADQELSNIRAEFLEKAGSVIRGYELRVDGEECSAEKLYEGLMNQNYGRVSLAPKSRGKALLGMLGEEDKSKAKEAVLRYLMGETASKLAPVLREKHERAEGVNRAFLDLKGLEVECKEAEELRVKAEKDLDSMRVEILGIRMSKAFAYSKKEKLQELEERYHTRMKELGEVLMEG